MQIVLIMIEDILPSTRVGSAEAVPVSVLSKLQSSLGMHHPAVDERFVTAGWRC